MPAEVAPHATGSFGTEATGGEGATRRPTAPDGFGTEAGSRVGQVALVLERPVHTGRPTRHQSDHAGD